MAGFVVGGVSGCGGSAEHMLTAKVSGTVTMNGQPVTGGGILFSPIVVDKKLAGKPSAGSVLPDGTFSLTTYEAGDGAVIGMHRVVFSPPPALVPDAPAGAHVPAVKSPFDGLVPKVSEVEIKSGDNPITIELVPGTPK